MKMDIEKLLRTVGAKRVLEITELSLTELTQRDYPMFEPEVDRLKQVCNYELDMSHGRFLTHFMEAFLKADVDNKKILLPTMKLLQKKYRLKRQTDIREMI